MQVKYDIYIDELNEHFIESVKNTFEDKHIHTTITEYDSDFINRSIELQARLTEYKNNQTDSFSYLDKDFWDDTKKRLIKRHQK